MPVLRVNTNDPEAVVKVAKFATRYWQKFGKDICLDMIGYRFYGHNEVDEPSFTQPVMYKEIRSRDTPPTLFASKLIERGTVSKDDVDKLRTQIQDHFEGEYQASLTM